MLVNDAARFASCKPGRVKTDWCTGLVRGSFGFEDVDIRRLATANSQFRADHIRRANSALGSTAAGTRTPSIFFFEILPHKNRESAPQPAPQPASRIRAQLVRRQTPFSRLSAASRRHCAGRGGYFCAAVDTILFAIRSPSLLAGVAFWVISCSSSRCGPAAIVGVALDCLFDQLIGAISERASGICPSNQCSWVSSWIRASWLSHDVKNSVHQSRSHLQIGLVWTTLCDTSPRCLGADSAPSTFHAVEAFKGERDAL